MDSSTKPLKRIGDPWRKHGRTRSWVPQRRKSVRINRVVLENYGLYLGRNEIDLTPRQKGQRPRPIVLIGGLNGGGKTTLLYAVFLALYGKSSAGERLSEKAYPYHL